MSEPFIGEIRLFGFNFAPRGWAFCNGQLVPIAQYQALFSLLGTTYGGDGRTTFALPDLRGRAPLHHGQGAGLANRFLGQRGGEESHTLTVTEMPSHNHNATSSLLAATGQANRDVPTGTALARAEIFVDATPGSVMRGSSVQTNVQNSGGSLPHNNMQPYLVLNFCIALEGVFPSRS